MKEFYNINLKNCGVSGACAFMAIMGLDCKHEGTCNLKIRLLQFVIRYYAVLYQNPYFQKLSCCDWGMMRKVGT